MARERRDLSFRCFSKGRAYGDSAKRSCEIARESKRKCARGRLFRSEGNRVLAVRRCRNPRCQKSLRFLPSLASDTLRRRRAGGRQAIPGRKNGSCPSLILRRVIDIVAYIARTRMKQPRERQEYVEDVGVRNVGVRNDRPILTVAARRGAARCGEARRGATRRDATRRVVPDV